VEAGVHLREVGDVVIAAARAAKQFAARVNREEQTDGADGELALCLVFS
jgi:hypothetical protein